MIRPSGPNLSEGRTSADFTVCLSDRFIIPDNITEVSVVLFSQWSHCDNLTVGFKLSRLYCCLVGLDMAPPGRPVRFKTVKPANTDGR